MDVLVVVQRFMKGEVCGAIEMYCNVLSYCHIDASSLF